MTNQIIGLIGGRKVLPRISPSVWAWTNAQLFGDVIIKIICLFYSSSGLLSCGPRPSEALSRASVWPRAGIFFEWPWQLQYLPEYFSETANGRLEYALELRYVIHVLKPGGSTVWALTSSKCAVTHWRMTSWMHKPFFGWSRLQWKVPLFLVRCESNDHNTA